MHDLKLHYLHSYRKAKGEGYDNFAASIQALYKLEFGEDMPTDSPHAQAGAKGGKTTGDSKRRDPAHYKRISALGVAARKGVTKTSRQFRCD